MTPSDVSKGGGSTSPLHILADVHGYVPRHLAGAETMLHSLLKEMAARGHAVQVLAPASRAKAGNIDGVRVAYERSSASYQWADVVVTHLDSTEIVVTYAESYGVPVAHLVHNERQLHHHRVKRAAMVMFNSQWIADRVRWGGGPSVIVRPPVVADDYRVKPGDHVTLVNVSRDKGSAVFFAMAKHFPDVKFLGVEGSYGPQETTDLPNVEIIKKTPDMRSVYERTRVVLMPSSYESWGRVAIEAAASGIPTIANPTHGLRESLGDAGIFADRKDLRAWTSALEDVLGDGWAAASKASLRRSKELNPAVEFDTFERALLEAARSRVNRRGDMGRNGLKVVIMRPVEGLEPGDTVDVPTKVGLEWIRKGFANRLGRVTTAEHRAPERAVTR